MCFVFYISYFACILCSKATVRAHPSLMCHVQLPGLLCYRTTVLLLLNKINDDDDDDEVTICVLVTIRLEIDMLIDNIFISFFCILQNIVNQILCNNVSPC